MLLSDEMKNIIEEDNEYIKKCDKGIWDKGQAYYYKCGKHAILSIILKDIKQLEKREKELIGLIIELLKLNICYKHYKCYETKNCVLNFNFLECPYVKMIDLLEKILNKTWEEIIKEV